MPFKLAFQLPLTFALILLIAGFVNNPEQPKPSGIVFFQGTWKEAVAKAKAENKCIFLDAYASWCGPCKTMDKEVYSNSGIGEYFNRKFVAVRVDMEKGEGPELAKKFTSIDGYPSLLFFNPDGSLSKTLLGSRHAGDFLQEARLVGK